jgi:hypothetical protein
MNHHGAAVIATVYSPGRFSRRAPLSDPPAPDFVFDIAGKQNAAVNSLPS